MTNQTKWTLVGIGAITLITMIVSYSTGNESNYVFIGAVMGLALIILPFLRK